MKKLLIGILVLASVSTFADSICRFDVWWIPQSNHGAVNSAKIKFKNSFTEEQCREEAELGEDSEYIIRVTDRESDHIVKTKYTFKSNGYKSSNKFKHGIWK